jgi:hypothetical protein
MAFYAIVLLAVVLALVFGPWPLAFGAVPIGLLLLRASDVIYARRRDAAIDAYDRARAG